MATKEQTKAKPATKKAAAPASTGKLKVTQVGSPIARRHDQRETLVGLGLNKIGRSRILENTPSIQGMITKVHHLVEVEAA